MWIHLYPRSRHQHQHFKACNSPRGMSAALRLDTGYLNTLPFPLSIQHQTNKDTQQPPQSPNRLPDLGIFPGCGVDHLWSSAQKNVRKAIRIVQASIALRMRAWSAERMKWRGAVTLWGWWIAYCMTFFIVF